MGGLPPGTGNFPRREPPSMQRQYMVATENPTGGFTTTGPFMVTKMPDNGSIQVANFGQMVTIDEKLKFPLESFVKARCIVTDIGTNVSYTVDFVRVWSTHIEVFVKRSQADT